MLEMLVSTVVMATIDHRHRELCRAMLLLYFCRVDE